MRNADDISIIVQCDIEEEPPLTQPAERSRRRRLERVERTLEAQKAFIHRVPDPDTRERAEANLMALVEMRERLKVVA